MSGDTHDLYLRFLDILRYDKEYAAGMFYTWSGYVERIIKNKYYFFGHQDETFREFVDFVDHNGFQVSRIPTDNGIDVILIMRE